MNECHSLKNICVKNGVLEIEIDGKFQSFNLVDISKSLSCASQEELENFEISPSGYGIHWPLIDEDISIDGLLGIKHFPDTGRKSA